MKIFDAIHSRRRVLAQIGAAGLGACAVGMAPAARAEAPAHVRITSTAGLQSLTVKYLMQSQKYLQHYQIDPEFLDVTDGSKIISGLIGGSADICIFSGFGGVLPAIEKGGALKILAGSLQTPVHQIYASDPKIKVLADLKGKTVGVGPLGALLHQIMIAMLTTKGVDPSTVYFVNAGSSTDVYRAVAAGKVDAGPSDFDYYNPPNGPHVLSDGVVAKELPEFTFQASYTSNRVIKAKRDALVRTLAAYAALYRFMESPAGKDAYFDAFYQAAGKKDMSEAAVQWNWIQAHAAYSTNLILSPARVDYAQKLNLATGVQKRKLTYAEATDMSIARDAIAMVDKSKTQG